MDLDSQRLLAFLEPQIRDYGANVQLEENLWMLFALEAGDRDGNEIARTLLTGAPFKHDSGASEDDQWMLYYVETSQRAEAQHWLGDLGKVAVGEIRTPSPAQRALVKEVIDSNMPHRVAHRLAEMHTRGELVAGTVREPAVVRALLDRLHVREPLFFSAFQILLSHHLVDMVVLLQQTIPEDVVLENEIVTGALSRDPFLQSRQTAAVEIRNLLIRFQIINPLDQQKNTAITNPYAVHLDIMRDGDVITAPIDGNPVRLPCASFVNALHSIRRTLYYGGQFDGLNTQEPWMTEDLAYSFRFIKQRLDSRRDLAPMDGLYMLERAVEA